MISKSDNGLRLLVLRLEGFGPFRRPVEFRFPAGLGVLVGPNEMGKSSLAAAISAAFFGMPKTSDPSAFGVDRYRNWDNPARFEAALEFTVDGKLHRLQRNFDTHRIALMTFENGGWRQSIGGEHNPNARKPNATYAAWLAEIFGHESRTLFEATFSVRQPFVHDDRLDAELQSLLAGGGAGHDAAALALVDRAKALTLNTKALGLTPRDGRRPGRLDEVREAIRNREEAIASAVQSVDSLQRITATIGDLTERIAAKHKELRESQASLAAVGEWRHLAQKTKDESDAVAQLRRALREIDAIDEALKAASDEAQRRFAAFVGAPKETPRALETLEAVVRKRAEAAALEKAAQGVDAELNDVKQQRAELLPFPIEGELAVTWAARVRSACARARQAWETYERLSEELGAVMDQREAKFGMFEQAAPAALERLAAGARTSEALRARLAEAQRALKSEMDRFARLKEARERALERYLDLQGKEELLPDIAAALAIGREVDVLQSAMIEAKAKARRQFTFRVAGLVAAAAAALAPWFAPMASPAATVVWIISAIVAAACAAWPWIGPARSLAAKLDEIDLQLRDKEQALRETRLKLGPWQDAPDETLEAARRRLTEYIDAMAVVETLHDPTDAVEEIRRLEAEVERAESELRAYREEIAPFEAQFGDFNAALGAWRGLCDRSSALEAQIERVVAAWKKPAMSSVSVEALDPDSLAGDWAVLFSYYAAVHGDGADDKPRPSQLAAWARSLDESHWSRLEERAREYDRLAQREMELEVERKRLRGSNDDRGALAAAKEAWDKLVNELQLAAGGDWSAFRSAALDPSSDESVLLQRVPGRLGRIVQEAGGASRARAMWEEYRSLAVSIETMEARRETALKGWGCEDAGAMERLLVEAEARLRVTTGERERLLDQRPGLAALEGNDDFIEVDRRIAAMRSQAEALAAEVADAENSLRELRREQATLQGMRPLNLAQAEVELASLRAEEERLAFEVEAIALAHQCLTTTVAAFYENHLDQLSKSASEYFAAFSNAPGRRVVFDEGRQVAAVEADGRTIPVAVLSQGTRDQLYLALRLAIADLISWRRPMPLVLDDPFVNTDAHRLAAIHRALRQAALRRQILVFSHQGGVSGWGESIAISDVGDA